MNKLINNKRFYISTDIRERKGRFSVDSAGTCENSACQINRALSIKGILMVENIISIIIFILLEC